MLDLHLYIIFMYSNWILYESLKLFFAVTLDAAAAAVVRFPLNNGSSQSNACSNKLERPRSSPLESCHSSNSISNQQLGEDPWTAERIRQWSFFPKKRKVVRSLPFLWQPTCACMRVRWLVFSPGTKFLAYPFLNFILLPLALHSGLSPALSTSLKFKLNCICNTIPFQLGFFLFHTNK